PAAAALARFPCSPASRSACPRSTSAWATARARTAATRSTSSSRARRRCSASAAWCARSWISCTPSARWRDELLEQGPMTALRVDAGRRAEEREALAGADAAAELLDEARRLGGLHLVKVPLLVVRPRQRRRP